MKCAVGVKMNTISRVGGCDVNPERVITCVATCPRHRVKMLWADWPHQSNEQTA